MLLISRPVLQNIVLNYYNIFIVGNNKCVEMCLFLLYTYLLNILEFAS